MNEINDFMDFLDDKMNDADEQRFAESFAYDKELRSNFKKYLMVTGSVRNIMMKSEPSENSKEKFFASIGIIPEETPAAGAVMSGNSFFGSKLFISGVTALVSILATAAFMMYFNRDSSIIQVPISQDGYINKQAKQGDIVNNHNGLIQSVSGLDQQAKNDDSKQHSTDKHGWNKSHKYTGNREIANNADDFTLSDQNAENFISPPDIRMSQLQFSFDKQSISTAHRSIIFVPYERPQLMPEINDADKIELDKRKFSIEFKNSINWNLPQAKISPTEYNKLNNMELGLYYKVFESLDIGLSLKQETFYLEYKGTENNVQNFDYEQQPNFTSFLFNVRYFPIEINGFCPYVQLGSGVNNGGIVAVPSLGLEYKFYPGFAMLLGCEYDYFRFIHQNSWFETAKFGISYGIAFNF